MSGAAPAHARLAPSSAARWVECPGSVLLQEQFPEPEDGEDDGAEGTAAHALAARILRDGEVAEAAADVMPYVRDVLSEMGHLYVEDPIKVPSVHATECWGTPDAYRLDYEMKVVYLWDLKFGYGHVEVLENWQLLTYASGIIDRLGPDGVNWRFVLRIVQPRAYHRDGIVRTWVAYASEVRLATRRLRAAAEEALGNNPSTNPGPHCKHCSARHVCKALQGAALDVVDLADDASPLVLPPAGLARELRALWRARIMLEARLIGLEAQAMAEIRKGVVVPGWTIDHPPGREEWVRPAAEVLALGELMGVKLAKPAELITPNQARAAGLDATVVTQYAARKTGTAKLIPITTTEARKAFGGAGAS